MRRLSLGLLCITWILSSFETLWAADDTLPLLEDVLLGVYVGELIEGKIEARDEKRSISHMRLEMIQKWLNVWSFSTRERSGVGHMDFEFKLIGKRVVSPGQPISFDLKKGSGDRFQGELLFTRVEGNWGVGGKILRQEKAIDYRHEIRFKARRLSIQQHWERKLANNTKETIRLGFGSFKKDIEELIENLEHHAPLSQDHGDRPKKLSKRLSEILKDNGKNESEFRYVRVTKDLYWDQRDRVVMVNKDPKTVIVLDEGALIGFPIISLGPIISLRATLRAPVLTTDLLHVDQHSSVHRKVAGFPLKIEEADSIKCAQIPNYLPYWIGEREFGCSMIEDSNRKPFTPDHERALFYSAIFPHSELPSMAFEDLKRRDNQLYERMSKLLDRENFDRGEIMRVMKLNKTRSDLNGEVYVNDDDSMLIILGENFKYGGMLVSLGPVIDLRAEAGPERIISPHHIMAHGESRGIY